MYDIGKGVYDIGKGVYDIGKGIYNDTGHELDQLASGCGDVRQGGAGQGGGRNEWGTRCIAAGLRAMSRAL
jgi:DNA-binding IclR family transcriptional regulator